MRLSVHNRNKSLAKSILLMSLVNYICVFGAFANRKSSCFFGFDNRHEGQSGSFGKQKRNKGNKYGFAISDIHLKVVKANQSINQLTNLFQLLP